MLNKNKFFVSFFFLLMLSVRAGSTVSDTTWVINPTKIATFDVNEQERLKKALSLYGINAIYDPTLQKAPEKRLASPPQTLRPLLQGKYVQVVQISPGLEPLHIGLVVDNISTLQGKPLLEFTQMIRHTIQTFHDLGYGDYLAFCDLGKTYVSADGEKSPRHCWEMIPLGKGQTLQKKGTYFLAPKIWRNNYVLFNATPYFTKEDSSLVPAFKKILQTRLTHKLSHSSEFAKETLPWEIDIPDFEETRQATLTRLLGELKSLGAVDVIGKPATTSPSSSLLSAKGEEFSSHKTQTREKCAFCRKKVITTQGMVKDQHITVLYNYQPYTKDKHFMIVPFAHQESFCALPADHFEGVIRWAQKLTFALGDSKNVIWFCQNGPFAGQTTPHAHLHVLERPAPVPLLSKILYAVSGEKEAFPTEDDYKTLRTKLLKALKRTEKQHP